MIRTDPSSSGGRTGRTLPEHRQTSAPRVLPLVVLALASVFTTLSMAAAQGAGRRPNPAAGVAATPPSGLTALAHSLSPEGRRLTGRWLGRSISGLTSYKIDLDLDLDLYTFRGRQLVRWTNRTGAPRKQLVFRIYPNATGVSRGQGSSVKVLPVVLVDGRRASHTSRGTVLTVTPTSPIPRGRTVTVSMGFKGVVPRMRGHKTNLLAQGAAQLASLLGGQPRRKPSGQGTDYGIFAVGNGIASLGLFHPILAAYRPGKGWDRGEVANVGDFSYFRPANFDVRLRLPAAATVVGSGRQVSVKTLAGKRKEVRHVAAAVREVIYLVSRRFKELSKQVGAVRVSSVFLKGHEQTGARVLGIGAAALKLYSELFGPYPYSELKLVEAPLVGGAGGVEFPGIAAVATMFYQPTGGRSGRRGKAGLAGSRVVRETLEWVVAHEVSHQWWGAVVGADSREHPVVDEALAQFSALLYFERVKGTAAGRRARGLHMALNYHFYRMMGARDGPADRPARRFSGRTQYAGLVYGKAPFFYDRVRRIMGPAAFHDALRRFFRRFAFKEAGPRSFTRLAAGVAGKRKARSLWRLHRRWFKGRKGDRDLGRPSLVRLLSTISGRPLDPRTKRVLRMMGPLLRSRARRRRNR